MSDINKQIGMRSLDALTAEHLRGKSIFIRCDFNVPLAATEKGYYRVADDTRMRRFLDTTFKKIQRLIEPINLLFLIVYDLFLHHEFTKKC